MTWDLLGIGGDFLKNLSDGALGVIVVAVAVLGRLEVEWKPLEA